MARNGGSTGPSQRKINSHNEKYWARLKKQFESCTYSHTGAYAEQHSHRPDKVKDFATVFEKQFEKQYGVKKVVKKGLNYTVRKPFESRLSAILKK